MTFASGKNALAICDRCGHEVAYSDLREETVKGIPQGNAVCGSCYDEDHPQNWVGQNVVVDNEGLRDPKPEPNLSETRSLAGWSPVGAPGNRLTLLSGKVSVRT